MKKIKKKAKISLAGFSLIELLVTVIILGILVSISLPQYARSVERAKCAQAMNVLQSMRSAALSYFSDNQTFFLDRFATTPITSQDLERQTGARFYSNDVAANDVAPADVNENDDWFYEVTAATNTRIQLRATRRRGRFAGNVITLTDDMVANQNEEWSDPAVDYPWDDPGGW